MTLTNKAQKKLSKRITYGPNGEKIYPKGTLFTLLKFKKSDRTDYIVGFVSHNTADLRTNGVREEDDYLKKVCVVDSRIAGDIILGALYQAAMVPMRKKNGYVVIDAKLYQFTATIETNYIKNAVYVVNVRFGNMLITFDPKDGVKESMRSVKACKELLQKRIDIRNVEQVIKDFEEAANDLLDKFNEDGYYVKKGA